MTTAIEWKPAGRAHRLSMPGLTLDAHISPPPLLPGAYDFSPEFEQLQLRDEAYLYNAAIVGKLGDAHSLDTGLEDLQMSLLTGFLPATQPLQRLDGKAALWEKLWDGSRGVDLHSDAPRAKRWRDWVEQLEVIGDISFLDTLPALQRAHSLLAYLAHRYVHSLPDTGDVPNVPDTLALPLVHVSARLNMPPVLTYADTVLWNWHLRDPHGGFTWECVLAVLPGEHTSQHNHSNLDVLLSFTETTSERHFYLVSAIIENIGAPALRIMSAILDEAWLNDATTRMRIVDYLHSLAPHIDACTAIVAMTRAGCEPDVFYHQIRPWFNGGPRHMAGEVVDLGGPSAGQSTLVHALDVFLGIVHTPDDDSAEATFMIRMQDYMPLGHRIFLRHLVGDASEVRLLAKENRQLKAAYDKCIDAMQRLRDEHMRIVAEYIVKPARWAARHTRQDVVLRGTGGSAMNDFLRRTRQATLRAKLVSAVKPRR